jgi:hypothetical protein
MATDTNITIMEQPEMVFSIGSPLRLHSETHQEKLLIASGGLEEWNVKTYWEPWARWKPVTSYQQKQRTLLGSVSRQPLLKIN